MQEIDSTGRVTLIGRGTNTSPGQDWVSGFGQSEIPPVANVPLSSLN